MPAVNLVLQVAYWKKTKKLLRPPKPQFLSQGRKIWQKSRQLVGPRGKKFWGPHDPLGGRFRGSNFFLPHPLPQNPLVRSRDFDGFEVQGKFPKNPENLVNIWRPVFEILTQVYDEPMGPMKQCTKPLIGVDYILMDTPSHSAWSESRVAQHFRPSTCHKAAVRARIRQKGAFRGL